jgi:NADPH:quinone reductase
MQQTLPATIKAVRQHETGGRLVVEEIPMPKPGAGEVLVKMAFSPINPSDLSQLNGTFHALPNYPFVPGLEGSGIVVGAGSGLLPRLRLGKRVSCTAPSQGQGTWAEYMVTQAARCIPISQNTTMQQAAMGIVNPMTAMGFMDEVKQGQHKAFVNNAAAGALGKMVLNLAKLRQIPAIHIVRKQEQVQPLIDMGADYVLCSSDPDYQIKLTELCERLKATLFFDAVGGNDTSVFCDVSPKGSHIVLYANLSEEPFTAYPRQILQNDKVIRGFSLGSFLQGKTLFQKLQIINQMKKLTDTALYANIHHTYSMLQANQAISDYKENMSRGKALIRLSE